VRARRVLAAARQLEDAAAADLRAARAVLGGGRPRAGDDQLGMTKQSAYERFGKPSGSQRPSPRSPAAALIVRNS
jgi:hypothetical protein